MISEITNGVTPEIFRLFLEEFNIEARPLWKPMHLQPVFEKYPCYGGDIAATLFKKGLCLPSSSTLYQVKKARIKESCLFLLTGTIVYKNH